METLVGAVVLHEVVDKSLREVETSAGVALQSAWGHALTSRWTNGTWYHFCMGRQCRVALLNSGRDRSCVGISFPTGVTPTAGKVRLKSCDCPAKSLPPMAWHPSCVLSHLGTAFSLEVTGCVSCGSFYQSLHCEILSFPPPSTAVVPHHCLACAIATALTDCGFSSRSVGSLYLCY